MTGPGDEQLEGCLCQAVRDGDNDGVVRALREGADPNCQTKDWNKTRPVILAASAGSLDIIKTLLAQETLDPNLTDELFGNTALIDASYAGNNDVVEELVADTRTEVNFRTERSGLTALMQVRLSNSVLQSYLQSCLSRLLAMATPRW